MKASAETMSAAPVVAKPMVAEKSLPSLLAELFKARLTLLVVLTTLVGFYLGSHGPLNGMLMLHTVIATALVASGAAALNQLLEVDYDARMRRTQDRPLPSGRMTKDTVLIIGAACAGLGLI